ncbi:GTPase ObgE [Candidatus Peregrinibacteria bacterium]|nr:GTPase ObgE [Candidatus Peregrinibacteria bacterium]
MFCDELKLKIIAGNGGNGGLSFRREKFVPRGGPDGGDGGRGGNIIFRANPNLNTLSHLANRKMYKAESGGNGRGNNMTGKNAEDLILDVPQGTVIYTADKKQLLADLNKIDEQVILAKGGKGGLGNLRFASSTNQAPKFAENGEPGEDKEILLELKLVADVGFIGLPSVGKSTLISIVSNARPKIAAYHFTTLTPNLGVVNMAQFGGSVSESFVVADIPGLIEGASEGKGLGHKFLRHVSRTKLLVHIIDGTSEDPRKDYKTINAELKLFDKKLYKLKQITVLNKIDMLSIEKLDEKLREIKKITKKVNIFPLSCMTKNGLKPLMFEIFKGLGTLRAKEKKEIQKIARTKSNIPILQPHLEKVKFVISRIEKTPENTIFHINGKRIEQLASMTDIHNPEGLERIYHFLGRMGIQKAVERQGATFGDNIAIKGKIIPYRK